MIIDTEGSKNWRKAKNKSRKEVGFGDQEE